jgi:hypothetical protein
MSTALYVLANDYIAAAQTLADLEMDPQTVADTLEGLSGDLEVKATNVAMFVRNLEASAEQIKAAESAMATRRKAIESRAESVRGYLKMQMERTGITKIECAYFKLAIRENPPAVVIDAESQIPAEFLKTPEPPPPSLDRKAIAAAIKAGREVTGAHMERATRLEIK